MSLQPCSPVHLPPPPLAPHPPPPPPPPFTPRHRSQNDKSLSFSADPSQVTTNTLPNTSVSAILTMYFCHSGAHCAHVLATTLPQTSLLLLIEKSSHMIHRFVLPRYTVYPSHEHKAFIPYGRLLHNGYDVNSRQRPTHCETRVIQACVVEITNGHIDLDRHVEGFGSRVPYNFLVYALGAKLPGFLSTVVDSDKASSTSWICSLQAEIIKSTKVVVVGGGALGIQYASDIKDRFPEKSVTLIHSHNRFLPLYDEKMHDKIHECLKALGVETVFNDRVTSSLNISQGQHFVTTRSGLRFECDLQLNCTGLSYNSGLLATLSPQSLDPKNQCLHVLPTMQLADPRYPNIFVIGDVADTTALKNAVSGWFQGEVVARNVTHLVRKIDSAPFPPPTPAISLPTNHGQMKVEVVDELESYTPGPPVIKLTLGRSTYLYQRPDAETLEPEVGFYEAKEDLDAAATWNMYGADTGDLFA
jgi:apoptosis-inducing factor 2